VPGKAIGQAAPEQRSSLTERWVRRWRATTPLGIWRPALRAKAWACLEGLLPAGDFRLVHNALPTKLLLEQH